MTNDDQLLLAIAFQRELLLPLSISSEGPIIARIREHRLEGRFLQLRIPLSKMGYSATLTPRIEGLFAEIEEQYDAQCRALATLCSSSPGLEGLVIKGFTTFLLTSNAHTLRVGDVDILCNDPQHFISTLEDEGYTRTRASFMHEVGEFTKDLLEIDLQRGFPLTSPPPDMNFDHNGLAELPYREMPLLTFLNAEFDAEASKRLPGSLYCLNLESAVLVLAAHLYMDFINIWSLSRRLKPRIRLCELADIHTLMSDARFDLEHFHQLAASCGAPNLPLWITEIQERLINERAQGPEQQRSKMAINLWWNLWGLLPIDKGDLLHSAWYPFHEVRKLLLSAGAPSVASPCETHGATSLAWQPLSCSRGCVQITLERTHNRLTIHCGVRRPGWTKEWRIRMETGRWGEEHVLTHTGTTLSAGPHLTLSACHDSYNDVLLLQNANGSALDVPAIIFFSSAARGGKTFTYAAYLEGYAK